MTRTAAWPERHAAYLLIAPTLLGVVLVDIYPLLYNTAISFRELKIWKSFPFQFVVLLASAVLCEVVP